MQCKVGRKNQFSGNFFFWADPGLPAIWGSSPRAFCVSKLVLAMLEAKDVSVNPRLVNDSKVAWDALSHGDENHGSTIQSDQLIG